MPLSIYTAMSSHLELIDKISTTIKDHYSSNPQCLGTQKKRRAPSTKPPTEKQVSSRAKFGEISKARAAEIKEHRAANPGLSYKEARSAVYGKYKQSAPAPEPQPAPQ